jgi:hypothetical protein
MFGWHTHPSTPINPHNKKRYETSNKIDAVFRNSLEFQKRTVNFVPDAVMPLHLFQWVLEFGVTPKKHQKSNS